MGTQREEIIVSVGLENKAIQNDLRNLKEKFHEFGQTVKGIFTSVFGQIGAERLVEGVLSGMERTMARAKEIRANAFAKGVSTDFIQDVENVGKAAGVSGEEIENMMNKFVKGLPAGADVEKSFYAFADRLKQIADPAERARLAVQAFGRSGLEMVKIMGDGSESMKDLANQFSKFSEAELASMEIADRFKERGESWISGKFGQLFEGAAIWGRYLKKGAFLGDGMSTSITEVEGEAQDQSDEQKAFMDKASKFAAAQEHNKELAKARAAIKKATDEHGTNQQKYVASMYEEVAIMSKIEAAKGDELAQDKLQVDLIKQKADTEKLRGDIVRETAEAKKKEAEAEKEIMKGTEEMIKSIFEQWKNFADTVNKLGNAKDKLTSEFTPTLTELAQSGYWVGRGRHRRWIGGYYSNEANREINLEQEIKNDVLWGRGIDPEKRARLQSIRDDLTKAGVYSDPNKGTFDEIKKLTAMITPAGLSVIVTNTDETA